MGECNSGNLMLEKEEDLVAAAQQIVRALEKNKDYSKETIKILADLGAKLSSLTAAEDNKDDEGVSEIENRLCAIQIKVMNWVEDESMIFDRGSEEAYEYVKIVDEARILAEQLENMCLNKDSDKNEYLSKAHDVIQTAMVRLEDEFKHMLVENRQPFEPEHMSFRSTEEDILDDRSVISSGDDSFEESLQRERDSFSRRSSEDVIVQLVHPSVIPDLKCIANLMFDSNYDRECTQAFISVRKEALDECLYILEVEKLSIEDVMKMEWVALNSKIRRWIKTMKTFIRVYLASERGLSDQVFGDLDSISSTCFTEASKGSILQLLTFAEAIAIGPHTPEKLLKILDMYEVLANLIPDIEALYTDEAGFYVRNECLDVLKRLGQCGKATFLEFKNLVASNLSNTPFAGGGIHHITRYVMNYMRNLNDYIETLNILLRDDYNKEDDFSSSPDLYQSSGEQSLIRSSSHAMSLTETAIHCKSLISILECNLDDKSKLYKDDSLGHIFLMNNTHYITEKVKSSELRTILGDEWIRKHNWKFQQHAMNYERSTWSSILSLLRDEGLYNPGSSSVSKTLLKERLHHFYLAFEEVYKNQTAWLIPDSQLRDDLRISTSLKVIQAYRTFVGRHVNHLSEKNIKYSADELEDYLLDLFEGSPKSLHSFHRK